MLCIWRKIIFSANIILWKSPSKFVGNNAKGRISKRVFQENKARPIFWKTYISYPLIRIRTFLHWYSPFFSITDELSKNEPVCMCKEGWCVGLGQEWGRFFCVRVGGVVWNTLKEGEIEKRVVKTKILKRGCKLG